jgi:undecaprenyl-diphosphatase
VSSERPATRVGAVWRYKSGIQTVILLLALALFAGMMATGGPGTAFDERYHRLLYAGNNPMLVRNAQLLTEVGAWYVLIPATVLAGIVLFIRRRMRVALLLVMVFGGRLLVELAKILTDRQRPGISPHLEAVHSMSFPSGHTANATITWLAIALLIPVPHRLRPILVGVGLAVALQVGWSRVALGVHWPSDVIGGWGFGLAWVILCMRLASARPDAEPSGRAR